MRTIHGTMFVTIGKSQSAKDEDGSSGYNNSSTKDLLVDARKRVSVRIDQV